MKMSATISPILILLIACSISLRASAEPPTEATASPTTAPAKQWVSDLTQFLNDHPGHWIVGNSTQPALSADEAESSACRDAANSLVVETLEPRFSRSTDRRGLVDRVRLAMQQDGWIADRQIQSKVRPYGTIWSASVLVDATPKKVDGLIRQIERGTEMRRNRTVAGAVGGSVLCGGIALGYMLMNWLTRGYFRGRLALASLLIASAGIFGIVHLI